MGTDYARILELSESMLAAARENRWDALIGLEQEYASAVLSNSPETAVQPGLIEAILENDAEIRTLVKARMDDLQGAMASVGQAIRLNEAYRP